ncbi:MAG: hypothetical protein VYA30_03805 [Myxococcota bacterium]|nr:hypothetical protein [Myxococcota bacterium]
MGLGPGYGQRALQFHLDIHAAFGAEDGATQERTWNAFMPTLKVSQPVGRNEVEVFWAMNRYSQTLTVNGDEVSSSTFRLSNPSLTYFFTWRTLSRQLRLGVGATAPIARLRTEKDGQQVTDLAALSIANSMFGGREQWLWAPDSMSLIMHFDYFFRHRSGFIFGTRMVAAPTTRIGDSFNFNDDGAAVDEPDDFGLFGQADLELAWDTEVVRTAVRGSYSIDALSDAEQDQKDQIASEVELRFRLSNVDLLLGMSLNIDEPGGFSFDDGKVWAMRIGFASPTDLRLPE